MKKLQIMRYLILVLMIQVSIFAQTAVEFTGYKGNVNTVAFSPDSKTLLSGDEKGNLFLWDIPSAQKIHSLQTGDNITSVNFSTAAKDLAVYTSYEGDVTIVKASTREILKTLRMEMFISLNFHLMVNSLQLHTHANQRKKKKQKASG